MCRTIRISVRIDKVIMWERLDMVIDLINQILVEGHIPAEWELSTFFDFCKKKEDDLDQGNFWRLKLAI